VKKILLTTGLFALLTAATAAPTMAISDTASTPLPGTGAKVEVTAWQCSEGERVAGHARAEPQRYAGE